MALYEIKKTPGDTEWFRHDRFGMFIHFGLYSLPSRHEWVKTYECIPDEQYNRYFEHFDPDMCDPREWARSAKAAGMKYAVFTAKHHEGFCLWDTKYTDFNVMNTAYGKDIVREYVDAFRAEGIKIGLYYSLLDWHHPDFTLDRNHPLRKNKDAAELDKGRDMRVYAEYMRNQVGELLSNYGKIDIIWYDFSFKGLEGSVPENPWLESRGKGKDDWQAEKLVELTRRLQPGIIINNRTGLDEDIWTPEQTAVSDWVKSSDGVRLTWEACHTMSGSWGYYRDEVSWKTPAQLIGLLESVVSHGGNLIMNVGPTSRGYLDSRAEDALAAYARWMKYNSRSIYGCTEAEEIYRTSCPAGCLMTERDDGKRLYVHLVDYPFDSLKLKGLSEHIKYAQFLDDGSEIPFTAAADNTFVMSLKRQKSQNQVIELILNS